MERDIIAQYSTFHHISSSASGAVFNLNSVNLFVSCCSFFDNSVASHGGCLYVQSSTSYVEKCSFESCYSTAKSAAYFGNAAYFLDGTMSFTFSSSYLCGIDTNKCTDSSVETQNAVSVISQYNASSNYGFEGGSGFSFYTPNQGSSAKYCTIYNSCDRCIFEFIAEGLNFKIEFSNFVKKSSINVAVCCTGAHDVLTISNCVFSELENCRLEYSNLRVVLEKCQTDDQNMINTNGIEKTDKVMTYMIIDWYKCDMKTCDMKKSRFSIFISMMMYISIQLLFVK